LAALDARRAGTRPQRSDVVARRCSHLRQLRFFGERGESVFPVLLPVFSTVALSLTRRFRRGSARRGRLRLPSYRFRSTRAGAQGSRVVGARRNRSPWLSQYQPTRRTFAQLKAGFDTPLAGLGYAPANEIAGCLVSRHRTVHWCTPDRPKGGLYQLKQPELGGGREQTNRLCRRGLAAECCLVAVRHRARTQGRISNPAGG
jgi:hypothetical protein